MIDPWKQAFILECAVAEIMNKQAHRGVHVNRVKAGFYIHVLEEKILELDRFAVPLMPKMLAKGCTAQEPYTKAGHYKDNVKKWFATEEVDLKPSGGFCGISWVPFDMGKTEAIKEYLAGSLGWEPDTWKFKDITMHTSIKRPLNAKEQDAALDKYMDDLKNTNLGKLRMQMLGIKPGTMTRRQVKELLLKKKKVPGGAKLTESSLGKISGGELGVALKARLTLAHRRSLLKGILELVRDDGRIEASAITIGTPTMRMRHKGVVNIPKAAPHVLFGSHCRSVFEAGHCDLSDNPRGLMFKGHWIPKGRRVLVGYDGAGLELRMLAHYVNDPEYTRQLVEGDIHSYTQKLVGLPSRDDAKTFSYATLYGAGNAKIGSIVGGGAQEGSQMKDRFVEGLPGLGVLTKRLEEEGSKGYIIGIDGRKLWLRRDSRGNPMMHKALNMLLQSAGSIVMKYACILLTEAIEEEGLDAPQIIHMHDEAQHDVHPRDVKRVMELMDICVKKAGEILGMNIELASDSIAGISWKYTH
jgi:DNA polymerase family A